MKGSKYFARRTSLPAQISFTLAEWKIFYQHVHMWRSAEFPAAKKAERQGLETLRLLARSNVDERTRYQATEKECSAAMWGTRILHISFWKDIVMLIDLIANPCCASMPLKVQQKDWPNSDFVWRSQTLASCIISIFIIKHPSPRHSCPEKIKAAANKDIIRNSILFQY